MVNNIFIFLFILFYFYFYFRKYGIHHYNSAQLNILEECSKKEIYPKLKVLNVNSAFGSEYDLEMGKLFTVKFPNLQKLFMSGWRIFSMNNNELHENDLNSLDSLEVKNIFC